jgi:hypothetical protein
MSLGIMARMKMAREKEMAKAKEEEGKHAELGAGLASMLVVLQQQERAIETLKLEIVERESQIAELVDKMADLPEVQRLVGAVSAREEGPRHSSSETNPLDTRILDLLSNDCPAGASAQLVAQELGVDVMITEKRLWNLEAAGLVTHGADGWWRCA